MFCALIKGGKQASEYASHEYAQFIEDIEHVQTMAEEGTITAAEAQALVDQHKLSMHAILLCVEGLGVIFCSMCHRYSVPRPIRIADVLYVAEDQSLSWRLVLVSSDTFRLGFWF